MQTPPEPTESETLERLAIITAKLQDGRVNRAALLEQRRELLVCAEKHGWNKPWTSEYVKQSREGSESNISSTRSEEVSEKYARR